MPARTLPNSPRCTAFHRSSLHTCSASCVPRRVRGWCRGRPVRSSSRLQDRGPGKSRPVPRRKPDPADDKVTAADIIAFIEKVCFIPEGKHVGKRLELFEWQKDEIRRIYDNPHGTRRAIISMGRKNAKTTLAACLLLAHLCGPPAGNKPNSQLYSAAQSRDQAAIIFSLAAKMVRMNPALAQAITIQETAKYVVAYGAGSLRQRRVIAPAISK